MPWQDRMRCLEASTVAGGREEMERLPLCDDLRLGLRLRRKGASLVHQARQQHPNLMFPASTREKV
eukprot:2676754-Rhodomonas_salina.1